MHRRILLVIRGGGDPATLLLNGRKAEGRGKSEQLLVIPAKAEAPFNGVAGQSMDVKPLKAKSMDPRLRGDDEQKHSGAGCTAGGMRDSSIGPAVILGSCRYA